MGDLESISFDADSSSAVRVPPKYARWLGFSSCLMSFSSGVTTTKFPKLSFAMTAIRASTGKESPEKRGTANSLAHGVLFLHARP